MKIAMRVAVVVLALIVVVAQAAHTAPPPQPQPQPASRAGRLFEVIEWGTSGNGIHFNVTRPNQ